MRHKPIFENADFRRITWGIRKHLGQREQFYFSSIISPIEQSYIFWFWVNILYIPDRCLFIMVDLKTSQCKTKYKAVFKNFWLQFLENFLNIRRSIVATVNIANEL